MKCPNLDCGLINPPDAIWCDCGFNFKKGKWEPPINTQPDRNPKYSQPDSNPKYSQSDRHIRPIRGGLSCPKCLEIAFGNRSFFIWLFVILLFPIGLLLLLTKKTYYCYKCGYTFKSWNCLMTIVTLWIYFPMKISLKSLPFLFILVFLSSPLHAQQTTTVIRIVDGDTLKVRYWGKEESIRLIGIDTPESRVNKKAKRDAKRSGKGYKDYYHYWQKCNKVCRRIS